MDWVTFLVSAAIGLVGCSFRPNFAWTYEHKFTSLTPLLLPLFGQVTVIGSLSVPKADIKVIFAILSAVGGYCVKTYLS